MSYEDDDRYDEWADEARQDEYEDQLALEASTDEVRDHVGCMGYVCPPQRIEQAAVTRLECDWELIYTRDEDGGADVSVEFSIPPDEALEIAGRQYLARTPVRSIRVVRRPQRSHLRARRTRRVRSRSGSRGSPPRSTDDPPLASRLRLLSERRAA